MQRVFIKKCLLFTVGSVCGVKRFITRSTYSLKDEEVETEMLKCLRQQSEDFFAVGFFALVKRRDKCISVGGGYVEKCFFFQVRKSRVLRFNQFVTYLLTPPPTVGQIVADMPSGLRRIALQESRKKPDGPKWWLRLCWKRRVSCRCQESNTYSESLYRLSCPVWTVRIRAYKNRHRRKDTRAPEPGIASNINLVMSSLTKIFHSMYVESAMNVHIGLKTKCVTVCAHRWQRTWIYGLWDFR
jgi:hypothetical protein